MSLARETIDPEPFPGLCSAGIGRVNLCRHAHRQHEMATGRLWLDSQIRERRRCRLWAQGYLAAVLGEPRPQIEHAAAGWYEARLHIREITTTRRRHV